MRRIAIASGKGGVGRTTLTANLGVALAKLKKKVLLMDAGFTTPDLGLFFKLEGVLYTLNDVLSGHLSPEDAMYDGPFGLKVMPLGTTPEHMKKANPANYPAVVKKIDGFDFILIDAPAGVKREAVAALRSAEEVIFVTLPETVSISDTLKSVAVADLLGLKKTGVVVNRIKGEDYEVPSDEIGKILDLPILAEIPNDRGVEKAGAVGKLFYLTSPNKPASKVLTRLARRLCEH
jgi:septum site-determining protein MinD